MANLGFEPPSFSLGFDFETQHSPAPDPLLQPAKQPSPATSPQIIEQGDDDDFESPVRVSDPPRSFKRLRREPTALPAAASRKVEAAVNEEIEDFSSDEDWPRGAPNSVCSSSKPSLHGQGVVTAVSGTQSKSRKGKQISSASVSVNADKKGSNVMFPKLTLSPLRRYQLIDSDSDDPSLGEKVPHVILSPEDKQSNYRSHLETRRSDGKHQSEDLWKDFPSERKSHSIPTPAFDEVIEEYFTNVKSKSKPGIECTDTFNETEWGNKATLHPPAHRYFFHKNPRIQKLVHDRLPYFLPLGAGSNQEHTKQNVSVIDYMGQFGHEGSKKQPDKGQNFAKSSTGSKKVVKKSQVASMSQTSDDWVNPRSYAGPQKNAGSRRVQAASTSSAGHWFTGPDGKRVYVNKQGLELTGQIAYRHYKKESGKGFKNSKKKTAAKKNTADNKKSVPKKK